MKFRLADINTIVSMAFAHEQLVSGKHDVNCAFLSNDIKSRFLFVYFVMIFLKIVNVYIKKYLKIHCRNNFGIISGNRLSTLPICLKVNVDFRCMKSL